MLKIKDLLAKISTGNLDSEEENRLVNLCINIAEAYLRTKYQKNLHLFNTLHGPSSSSIRDAAIDYIAELFERRDNRLVMFEKFIDSFDLLAKSESENFAFIRRLVFSEVNNSLFNQYKVFDPSLSKIIRNIKRGLNSHPKLALDRTNNAIHLKVKNYIHLEIPNELLSIRLSYKIASINGTYDMLEKLSVVLEESAYDSISLVSLAIVVREVFINANIKYDKIYSENSAEESLAEKDISRFIKESIQRTKEELYPSYVTKGKISEEYFLKYFRVAEIILNNEYVNDTVRSYFGNFLLVFEEETKYEYRLKHRKFIEYFVKKSRSELINSIKRENVNIN